MPAATARGFRLLVALCALSGWACANAQQKNLRDYGIDIGVLQPGSLNAITDVPGVSLLHVQGTTGIGQHHVDALPVDKVLRIMRQHGYRVSD